MIMTKSNPRPEINALVCCLCIAHLALPLGCAVEAAPDSEPNSQEPEIGQVDQGLYNKQIVIGYGDDRPASNVRVWLEGTDTRTGNYYWDYEDLYPGTFPGLDLWLDPDDESPPAEWYRLGWSNNANLLRQLHHLSAPQTNRQTIVIDDLNSSRSFRSVKVAIQATIAGACHYDYEWVNLERNVYLSFNGMNGSWQDNCYKGDFLK